MCRFARMVRSGGWASDRGVRSWHRLPIMGAMTRRWIIASLVALAALLGLVGDGMGASMSALRRTILAASPVAYWPMEDGAGATEVASALTGGVPMRSPFPLSLTTGPAGSAGALNLVGEPGSLIRQYPRALVSLPTTDEFQIEFVATSDQLTLAVILVAEVFTNGTGVGLGLDVDWADGVGHHRAVQFTQNGADVDIDSYVDGILSSSTSMPSVQIASTIELQAYSGEHTSGNLTLSHVAVYGTVSDPSDRSPAATGYVGETATARFARLCAEAGIAYDVAS
jgi:hypothetical protein